MSKKGSPRATIATESMEDLENDGRTRSRLFRFRWITHAGCLLCILFLSHRQVSKREKDRSNLFRLPDRTDCLGNGVCSGFRVRRETRLFRFFRKGTTFCNPMGAVSFVDFFLAKKMVTNFHDWHTWAIGGQSGSDSN